MRGRRNEKKKSSRILAFLSLVVIILTSIGLTTKTNAQNIK